MLSSLTGLDLTKQEDMLLFVSTQTTEFQNSQTGDQPYSDNYPMVSVLELELATTTHRDFNIHIER